MLKKMLLLWCMLALAAPVSPALAAKRVHARIGQKSTPAIFKAAKPARAGLHAHRAPSSRQILKRLRSEPNYRPMPARYQAQHDAVFHQSGSESELRLASTKALIVNQETGEVLYAKSTDQQTPIASVTKLMTAMVVLDAHQPLDEPITISEQELDTIKGTGSRLRVGTTLTRGEMLQLALMSSENRAAAALGNHYPGGRDAFVTAMNAKATALGMKRSRFVDGTGLNSDNVSTAEDLALMVKAAYQYPEIRQVTTTASYEVPVPGVRHPVEFRNSNILVRNGDWEIGLSKTGYISEAGRCLVMQAKIAEKPVIIVLLDSWGKFTRIGDAQRIRKWIESSNATTGPLG